LPNYLSLPFYKLPKPDRDQLVKKIQSDIQSDLEKFQLNYITKYFSDDDTYIRKAAYLGTGKIYLEKTNLRDKIISVLQNLLHSPDEKIRQTVVNAAGEIGKKDFEIVQSFFDSGLFDDHHIVRNAVIGSVKKMGEKNPVPVLKWAKKYLHHPDKEIRREICHGIELRGRTHPADILDMLKELENDTTSRVRNTLVHVLGQIAYKKDCLPLVIVHLKTWENKTLVIKAIVEIIDVHYRYRNFSYLTQDEARLFIEKNFGNHL